MSAGPTKRLSSVDIRARKAATPLVMLTAYTAPTAALADPHVDMLLVGDSVGMVLHGFESTLPVTLDMMILHGRAVVRGSRRALVVVDMPFGSVEADPATAFRAAARVMQETGCGAVKIEGGSRMAETIRFLVERGIPVMGHIGLTPQAVNVLGGFRAQGRSRGSWPAIETDAADVAAAGAFAIVLEAIAEPLAARIAASIPIPTIGIGASAACDGQVLVTEDLLGLTERPARFVKTYAALGRAAGDAIQAFAGDVRDRKFPAAEHTYSLKTDAQT